MVHKLTEVREKFFKHESFGTKSPYGKVILCSNIALKPLLKFLINSHTV